MTKVFIDIGVSVDGFTAGENRGPQNPLGDGGLALHHWMFDSQGFRRDSPAGDLIEHVFERTGAHVMGRNMFDEGEVHWSPDVFRGAPVFVLTHRPREPWRREGGTVFHFVTEGFDSALAQARAAAGDRDVRITGGADAARQAIKAGVVDELILRVAPVIIGSGTRLFDGITPSDLALEQTASVSISDVTHITYQPKS